MEKYMVNTGIVIFAIWADSPEAAIEALKAEIRYRGNLEPFRAHFSPAALAALDNDEPERAQLNRLDIGWSLVEALEEGRLNFLVFNGDRSVLLAGEHQGQYQAPPTRALARLQPLYVTTVQLTALKD
jgi:hypothetical protein